MNAVAIEGVVPAADSSDLLEEVTGMEVGFSDDDEWDEESVPDDPFNLNVELEAYAKETEEDEEPESFFKHEERSRASGIDEGDFVIPAEHFLFVKLKKRIRQAANVNTKKSVRKAALDWIFIPNIKDVDNIDFNNACRTLGARPIVIQARTMHQLWKANIHLSEPLDFLTIPPPTSILSEISAQIGPGVPENMARKVWAWPSIPTVELFKDLEQDGNVTRKACKVALDSLMANGYVGVASARVYFISRNPSILSKRAKERFAFSAAIYDD